MKKILIVEDDLALQQTYKTILTQEGYEVILAGTAQQGLQAVKTSLPDLILLDVMLPGGMNGFDVLETLKLDPQTHDIPIIMLTNLDNQEQSALSIGVAAYFVKSATSIETIVNAIRNIIQEKS